LAKPMGKPQGQGILQILAGRCLAWWHLTWIVKPDRSHHKCLSCISRWSHSADLPMCSLTLSPLSCKKCSPLSRMVFDLFAVPPLVVIGVVWACYSLPCMVVASRKPLGRNPSILLQGSLRVCWQRWCVCVGGA
jgi:hypothetical protein